MKYYIGALYELWVSCMYVWESLVPQLAVTQSL